MHSNPTSQREEFIPMLRGNEGSGKTHLGASTPCYMHIDIDSLVLTQIKNP